MEDQLHIAFEFAADLSKQLITIATALLALSITFAKDLVKRLGERGQGYLVASWLALLISVLFGVVHLATLTGSLVALDGAPPAFGSSIRASAMVQEVAFLLGMVMLVVYGRKALGKASPGTKTGPGSSSSEVDPINLHQQEQGKEGDVAPVSTHERVNE